MARTKGQPKTGGRQAGTPNKVTKTVRQRIYDIWQNNIDTLETDLQGLEPRERWQIINGLLPYIVSKRQETSNRYYTFDFPDKEFDDDGWERTKEKFLDTMNTD